MHQTMSSPNSPGSLSPNNNLGLKPCRSASEMDLEDRRGNGGGGGPLKMARTDSFHRQSDLKMHMNGSPSGTMVLSSSMVSDGRLGCSPTNSCASDGSLLGNDHGNVVSDARLLRQDSLVSASAYSGAQGGGGGRGPLSYHHLQSSAYHHNKPSGGGLSMGRESMNPMGQSGHNPVSGARAPFTTGQWAELEHQALIFKYMMAGVNVPSELLNPIRRSVATMNGLASNHATNFGWGSFHLGVPNNTDPEPGRCRRTDGKKWRCARDVVPDQKYCERHMHRGRHRSRRPAEGQTSSASQSGSATSSGPQPAIAVGASRTSTPTPGSSLTHSNLRPSILSGNSQSTTNLGGGGMGYNSPGGSGALSGGSSPAASSGQFQLPGLSSATGTSGLTSKDYRYNMNGMTVKSEMGMNPEQILFSEASGSTRGLSQEAQSLSNLSRLNTTMNKSWQSMTSSKVTPSPQPKGSGNSSLLSYTSPQMGGLLGQEFGLMPETSQVNLAAMAASQQQHSFLSNGYGGVETTSVGGRDSSEGQPLRHFFDDWPRSRADPSALAWGSDVEDSDRATSNNNAGGGATRGGAQSNHTSNNTQLSISIPTTAAPSGDFNSQSSGGSPSRGKLSLSPLKLSMSRAGDESQCPTGLGVGTTTVVHPVHYNSSQDPDHEEHHSHDEAWDPIPWEPSSVGGPLAEVLQSSSSGNVVVVVAHSTTATATTTTATAAGALESGAEWLESHHQKKVQDSSLGDYMPASPVDVLHKLTFASHSDSSTSTSSASSPRNSVFPVVPAASAALLSENSASQIPASGPAHLF